ncbi:hypothetical protein AVEN_195445-1 [Araneus ventricosus]|uniref:SEFIR domain-containing protein n=1 Tax=Araneus ventricosus TaxID=182803 RepID=A0A4Y2I1V2_ARAVE|nr:hypothetical protein AVEN_195445-1 [Araneus ventricosus]
MLLIWFVLSSVALITKTASNTIGENLCDLSPRCMNNSLSLPVIRSKQPMLRCTKRTCDLLDNNLVAVNQINKIDIHLKDIQIKQKKNGYQVQAILSSYDDLIKQGNQSLLVKFSFGRDHACYQFLIPSSVLVKSKDILLSCFRIPILQRDHLEILFFVYKETDEVISIQAMDYSLSNVTVGQWLGGSQFRITYDLDHEFIYFSLNATQDLRCLFNYSISVYKSHQNHPCSIKQTPVYRWTDTLNSPYHRLNMSQKLLSLSQIYCIYAFFSKFQECGTLQSKYFYFISFFQLVPPSCEKWNFSIDVKTNKPTEREEVEGAKPPGPGRRKDLIATMTLWKQYPSCFSSYCMYLYEFASPSCDTDYGRLIPWKFKFDARSNKTVIFNSPICGKGRGHLLLLGKFNFEARPNKTEVVFKNVTIGYYCIVVVPFLVDGSARYDWTRDSRPIIVTETGVNNIELIKDENTEFGTKVIVAISFLLFFTAFALWSCSAHIRRSKAKSNKVFSDEKEGKENMPLLTLPVDKVYLFHSHDDNSIKNDVSQLKNFLKDGAPFSVITLSDVLPEILEQSSRTVSNILECGCSGMGPSCASNKKFIIVISEKVLRIIDDEHLIWRSLEEPAFHMVLDFITANWRKAYCHLFLVAFNESIFEDRRFENMALRNVGAHYTIPDCLERLCVKLGFSSSRHMRREELPMCPER